MSTQLIRRFLKNQAKRLVAIVIIVSLFWLNYRPELSATERQALAARFSFTRLPLPELADSSPRKHVRAVHPSLERYSAWVSSMGASVALYDLDGDGLPNDLCHVDPRTDQVIVSPTPGTSTRYAPFELKVTQLPYNSRVMAPTGCLPTDLNEDGLTDILVYYWGRAPVAFLQTTSALSDQELLTQDRYIDAQSLGLSRSGWAWDAKLSDFDNDGVLEALQATGWIKGEVNKWPEVQELSMMNDQLASNPALGHLHQPGIDVAGHQHNPFYVFAANGRYYDIAPDIGFNEPQVSRGIAIADVDGDGDLDFAVANQWESSYFYRNENPTNGSFLGLRLLLPIDSVDAPTKPLGRPAIGASATVHLPDGQQLVAQVDGGNGHSGVRSPELHFGLGQLEQDSQLSVDLDWRDSQGDVHQQTLVLSPGWHTILLDQFAVLGN